MLIYSVTPADSGVDSIERGKTVVFASYHLTESENDSSGETVKSNWYPSLYLHDLKKNAVTWKVYGAEIFVNIDDQNNVMVFTNEIWHKLTKEEYNAKVS